MSGAAERGLRVYEGLNAIRWHLPAGAEEELIGLAEGIRAMARREPELLESTLKRWIDVEVADPQ